MQAIHAAIDPGRGGGWAWRNFNGITEAGAMPDDWLELAAVIRRIMGAGIKADLPVVFHVELVGGYVKTQRGNRSCRQCGAPVDENGRHRPEGQPGSFMFKFGENVGMALGMIAMTSATVMRHQPRVWQKVFAPEGRQGRERSAWKDFLKLKAQAIFPELSVTLRTADALLMLRYGELLETGAVAKPETERAKLAAAMEELPGLKPEMFIARWAGQDYVFQKKGERYEKIAAATAEDARKFPRGKFSG